MMVIFIVLVFFCRESHQQDLKSKRRNHGAYAQWRVSHRRRWLTINDDDYY